MRATSSHTVRESVSGMATGIVNMALFGAVWTVAGSGGMEGTVGVVALIVGWAVAAALIVGSTRLRRRAMSLPDDESPGAGERRRYILRRFNLVFILELLAIAVAVFILLLLGLGGSIPAVVALIVGIHFLPLAVLFEEKAYYLTGAVLCVLAVVAFFVAPDIRLALVGLGSAVTLFATAAYLLLLGGKATRVM